MNTWSPTITVLSRLVGLANTALGMYTVRVSGLAPSTPVRTLK